MLFGVVSGKEARLLVTLLIASFLTASDAHSTARRSPPLAHSRARGRQNVPVLSSYALNCRHISSRTSLVLLSVGLTTVNSGKISKTLIRIGYKSCYGSTSITTAVRNARASTATNAGEKHLIVSPG
ncbi:hypothetical protein PF004_g32238 [Phytophthora fragariae]|uniref:RxLR effector protein n=1 Tax=Phytophthora fragariae TaxID=53985 RepID=A0A6G0M7X8_9STRA|nr:hypothetical protein PF004_g32238 [Phytophthora fragariae]KAE9327112.1 hypothetical protein PF008_g16485 [Phytophthora fragariae]